MKKFLIMLCLTFLGLFLTSCLETSLIFNPDTNLDLRRVFFDDFDSGVDYNNWKIANEKWGVGNNGVLAENVNYTSDGVLVLQANGDYYEGPLTGVGSSSGKRTGAALLTRDTFGPGRYEVRSKILPRFGATSAFWTFYNDGLINHEIDIELNIKNDFHQSMFTNWLTETEKLSKAVETKVLNNDFAWHTYKFEWHTNPQRIDYYIDDILYSTATSYIPDHAGNFWIGHWFPDSWAGTPDFETDYMYVDWVKITPYSENTFIATDPVEASPSNHYPSQPIAYPQSNLISNPGFEVDSSAWRKEVTSQVQFKPDKAIKVPAPSVFPKMILPIK